MKKIISILICIQIALFPAFLYAQNVGGWTMSNPIAQGASTVYTGTKNIIINGADYVKKGTAIVTPTATGVAKVLAKGVAGVALSVAVEQLLGAVDWVLDPANNQIVYSLPSNPTDPSDPTLQYYYSISKSPILVKGVSPSDVCQKLFVAGNYQSQGYTEINVPAINENPNYCFAKRPGYSDKMQIGAIVKVANPAYDPTAENEDKKTLPLETVAQKVISNAQSGDTAAQVATGAAAADIVAEAESDQTGVKARPIVQQLESTSTTKPADEAAAEKANEATGEQTKNPDKPDTTDLKLTFPIFCNWAPTVCEAAQTVISFPKTLTNWWETGKEKAEAWAASISESWSEAKEWVTGEPDIKQDETDLPIEDKHLDKDPSSFDTDYIVLGSQCPYFEPYTVEVGPISKTLSMDLSPLCDFAAKVRPAIIGMSYLTAAGIVVAAIRET